MIDSSGTLVGMSHDFTLMLAVHDAVRRDLIRFVRLLGGTAPIGVDRARALADQWRLTVERVDEHERLERELLWPAARAAVPAEEQAPLDRMDDQHDQLTLLLETVTAGLGGAGWLTAASARRELADSIERAAVLADTQFAYEERMVLPLLDRWLPAGAWSTFVAAQHTPAGPLSDPEVLPWLLEESRPERVGAVLGLLPDEHRTAYEQHWKPAHRLRVAAVW